MVMIDRMPTAASVEGSGLLLQLIRTGRAGTVSELAGIVGVARSTVLQRLGYLQHWGLIRSASRATGSRGRPAAVLSFDPRAGVVLAAHVGLSGTRAAAVDLNGEILRDEFIDFDVTGEPAVLLQTLQRTFDVLLQHPEIGGARVLGVGIGTPSTFEWRSYARTHERHDTEWDPEWFRRELLARYRVPVVLDLDVNCLALAEHRASRPDAEVLVCVKLGTLIGSSVVVRGVPVRGANRLAGELGHLKVTGSDEPCVCGSTGCLDAVASGSALVRQLSAAGRPVQHVSQLVQLANEGDAAAVQIIRTGGRRIGEALSSVVNLLNPAAISMWGYLTEAETLLAGIRETLYSAALPASSEQLELATTSLGPLAGVRGAAMAVIDEVFDPRAVDRALVAGSWSTRAAG